MMEGSENMDRYFKEKLEDYKENPPQDTWDKIADRLGHNRKRRMVVFISRIAAGISILVSLSILFHYLQRNNHVELAHQVDTIPGMKKEIMDNQSAQTGERTTSPVENEVSVTEIAEKDIQERPVHPKSTDNQTGEQTNESLHIADEDVFQKGTDVKYATSANIPVSDKMSFLIPVDCNHLDIDASGSDPLMPPLNDNKIEQIQKVSTDQLLALTGEESDEKKRQTEWLLGGQFAPLYSYRNLASDQYQDYVKSQINSKESGILAYAGGINLTVSPNRRLSVQSGIYYSKYGQEKNSLEYAALFAPVIPNTDAAVYAIGNTKSEEGPLSVYIGNSTGKIIAEDEGLFNTNQSLYSNYAREQMESNQLNSTMPIKSITQYFEYLEIPVSLKYKILDRKFDVSLMGGISTNFLVGTNIQLNYTDNSNKNTDYTTEGLNRINYSGLVGIGFEYPMLKNLIFNVEPKFKYYMNPIDRKQVYDIHPYSIGIFSGFSYRF